MTFTFSRSLFAHSALAALLLFFSFPPYPTGFLSYFCLVPLFLLFEKQDFRNGFRTGYLTALIALGTLFYWLNWNSGANMVQATGMYISTVIYLSISWGIFGWIQNKICRRFGTRGLYAAPFVWTSLEFLQSLGELGFSWHSLATSQTYYPWLIQHISLTGMYSITFWIVLLNVLFFFLFKALRGKTVSVRNRVTYAALILILILVPLCHGWIVTSNKTPYAKSIEAGVVQPNIEPNMKWLQKDFAYDETLRLTENLPDHLDLIVWPETAIPTRLRYHRKKLNEIRALLRKKNVNLLTGIPDRRTVKTDQGYKYRSFNAVYYLRKNRNTIETYDKIHLVPFGEFVPSILAWLSEMAMDVGAGNYFPGNEYDTFSLVSKSQSDTITFSAVICLESVFAHQVQRFFARGAQFLVIITNDAWYDGTNGPAQHAQIAVLRAIENHASIIRCANSGISAIIDPYGTILQESQNQTQAAIYGRVPVSEERTFYTRHKYWFPITLIICAIGIAIFCFFGPALRN